MAILIQACLPSVIYDNWDHVNSPNPHKESTKIKKKNLGTLAQKKKKKIYLIFF